MIQRIQSVWLLLIAALAIFLVFLPMADQQSELITGLSYNVAFKAVSIFVAILSLITLFLYKNRSLQIKLCFGILFLLIVAFIMLFNWSVTVIDVLIPFLAIPISITLSVFAIRAIRKDDKLVRSLDRLR
jgi:hypothetical protein